ncbi:YebC/PmpR family DNA-binding transcriptional regulator [Acinetobacter baumannii]
MAGHSKWANIKHRKAKQDASRGKVFTKYIREIVTAAKLGGADPASNPRLRADVSLEDKIMDVALEAGAEDIEVSEDEILVITSPETFGEVQDALAAAGLKSDNAEVVMSPSTKAEITDIDQAKQVMKLIDMLEDLDDVQNVYTNVEFSDEVLAQLDA